MAKIVFLLTTTPWFDRRQFDRQAPALAAAGHQVIYISGRPSEKVDVPFILHPLSDSMRKKARKYGAVNCFREIIKVNPDVLQLCSLEQLPLGLLLKAFTSMKVIYDCREDMAEAMFQHRDNFPLPFRWLMYYLTKSLELLASKFFDGIITADPGVCSKHNRMPQERKMVFYNAAQLRDFKNDYQPLAARTYDLVVMGSMSRRTGVLDVVKAVGILKEKGRTVKAMLLGEPDQYVMRDILKDIEKYSIQDQIQITGKVPHREVPKILATAKIGIVPLHNLGKFKINIACKAFEYMACGMPSICSDLPPQRLFITEGKEGVFYPAADKIALVLQIEKLLFCGKALADMGGQARNSVENKWNAEAFESEFKEYYSTILTAPLRGRSK